MTTKELRALASTARVAEQASQDTLAQVIRAKEAGASWTEIGDALGISKQAAWERFVADWNDHQRGVEALTS